MPADPGSLLADHAAGVDSAYREVASRLDGDGPASSTRTAGCTWPRRVERMLPEIDLPELVLEVMSWVPGFTEAFTHAASPQRYRDGAAKNWITHLHQLQVVLYHRGQITEQPR